MGLMSFKKCIRRDESKKYIRWYYFLHCFASYEIGLVDILKSNRIKRILYLDGQAYYKYEHDVFEIDGCMELKKTYKESFEKK